MKAEVKYLILFLAIECCMTQEPPRIKCVDGYELSFFFKPKKNQYQAKLACQSYGNSRLVKVDNLNITKAINSVIGNDDKTTSYIDGEAESANGRNRKWSWWDGSKIYLRKEGSGYQNWAWNQPNNMGGHEDCIIVGRETRKWKDSRCNEPLGYICQKDPLVTVDSRTPNIYKCSATSSCAPPVEWRRDNVTTTTNSNQTVYQTKRPTTAALFFENATIGDRGEYVCATWIGEKKKFFERRFIKVNGTPSITDVVSFPCNSGLLVSWTPNQRAVGFPHRITAIPTDGGNSISSVVTPNEKVELFREINGLQANTEYELQISACQKNENCAGNDTTRRTATTNGTLKAVSNATLTQLSQNNTCTVLWSWPYNNTVTQFAITLHSNETFKNELVDYINETGIKQYAFSFEPQPKYSYNVKVQSKESIGICDAVQADGFCIGIDVAETSTSAPVSIGRVTRTVNASTADVITETGMLKIVLPIVGVVFLLIIAVIVIVLIKKRRNKPAENGAATTRGTSSNLPIDDYNTINLGMHSLQQGSDLHDYASVNREGASHQDPLNNLYSMASEAAVSATPQDAPVYAAINKKQRSNHIPEYGSLAMQHNSGNDTYDALHFDQHNVALTSTTDAHNEQYSSISRQDVSETDAYDTLHADQNTSVSHPVYAVVNRYK